MLWRTVGREDFVRVYGMLADRAGADLTPGQAWMISRLANYGTRSVAAMAAASHTPVGIVADVATQLQARGLAVVADGSVTITDSGRAVAGTVTEAAHAALHRIVDEWPGAEQPDVRDLVDEIAARLSRDDRPLVAVKA